MWIKLSTQYINLANIVRVEFAQQGSEEEVAAIFSVKPSGSDKTVLDRPEDVQTIKAALSAVAGIPTKARSAAK